MQKDMQAIEIKAKNMFVPITIAQTVCVVVLLIAILVIKFGFSKSFEALQKWCENNILEETVVSDVFDGEAQ